MSKIDDKCDICGGAFGIHHHIFPYACPKFGMEAPVNSGAQKWESTHFIKADMFVSKADAVLNAIRSSEVGDEVTICNEDGSINCIIQVVCREHDER